jgi:hypothetical protein
MPPPMTMSKHQNRERRQPFAPLTGSAASEADDVPDEREALAAGLAIVEHYEPSGESDFDKGMRLLQQALGVKKRKPQNSRISDGV